MREELDDNDVVVTKFTEESVKEFEKKVNRLASIDPNMPIIIKIDSFGGQVDAFHSMLAIMKSVPNTFVTVCRGKAMSAGAALLSVGDIRFCDSDARIMIHEASGGAMGSADDIEVDAREFKRLNRQIMTTIAERCGKTYEQLKEAIKNNEGRDLYLTPQQAKDIGLVDFIGLPQIRPSVSYTVECIPPKHPIVIQDHTKRPKIEINKKTKTESKKKTKKR